MNLFLPTEIEGTPEENGVVGTLTSHYCFVCILCLLNIKQSSEWYIIGPPLKQVRQLTKNHLRLTMLPNVVKASAGILSRVRVS